MNQQGQKYYHLTFKDGIAGAITDIKINDSQFGKMLEVTLTDESETSVLSVNMFSKAHKQLIEHLFHFDFNEPLCWIQYVGKKSGDKTYMNCYVSYELKFKGRQPDWIKREEYPAGVEKESRGETVWDYSEQDDWFYEKTLELIKRFEKSGKQVKSEGGFVTTSSPDAASAILDDVVDGIDMGKDTSDEVMKTKDTTVLEDSSETDDLPF